MLTKIDLPNFSKRVRRFKRSHNERSVTGNKFEFGIIGKFHHYLVTRLRSKLLRVNTADK